MRVKRAFLMGFSWCDSLPGMSSSQPTLKKRELLLDSMPAGFIERFN
jgi:hypothetical protein